MRTIFSCFFFLIFLTGLLAQPAETFVGDWTTSFGTRVNRVAADPNDPQQFYGLLDARKLQGQLEYYSVLVKYDCRGQFDWTRPLEGGDSTRQVIDMEVQRGRGNIGIFHADNDHFVLQWLRPGGSPIGNFEIERNMNWEPVDLAADPSGSRWYVLFRDNSGIVGHFGVLVVDESSGLQQAWQSDRVAFGKARLEVLPSGELMLAASGRMYSINTSSGSVEGWSWVGDDAQNIDFTAWEDQTYTAEWTDTGLRLTEWAASGPQGQWLADESIFPGSVTNLQIAANQNSWALMADVSMGGSEAPIGLLYGARGADFSDYLIPDVFATDGAVALDADERILYSGSSPNARDDHIFRLDGNNPCVESSAPGTSLTNGDVSIFTPIPVFDLQSISPTGQFGGIQLYTDIPPEDRRCQSFISRDDLAAVFNDTLVECADSVVLNHPFAEGVEWNGQPLPQPWVIRSPGMYTVSAPVCQRAESFTFTVEFTDCDCSWFMPNIFSPNGDGINDEFAPAGQCIVREYNLQIFDRWGQLVFESRDPNIAWNGRRQNSPMPTGVYVYRWQYIPLETLEPVEQAGSVTLVR